MAPKSVVLSLSKPNRWLKIYQIIRHCKYENFGTQSLTLSLSKPNKWKRPITYKTRHYKREKFGSQKSNSKFEQDKQMKKKILSIKGFRISEDKTATFV